MNIIGYHADYDAEADGMPDWWEQMIIDVSDTDDISTVEDVAPTDDYDEDGLTNIDEYELFSNPTEKDTDGDGIDDQFDAFPLISAESVYNPVVLASLDVDGDGEANALTDGLLIIRRLFGFSGDSLISGAVSPSATYTDSAKIAERIDASTEELDVDGDGDTQALTDGLLIIRRLFGFSGDSLISGAVSLTATRSDPDEIAAYIDSLMP